MHPDKDGYALCEVCRTKRPVAALRRDDSAPDGLARTVCKPADSAWCDAQSKRVEAPVVP